MFTIGEKYTWDEGKKTYTLEIDNRLFIETSPSIEKIVVKISTDGNEPTFRQMYPSVLETFLNQRNAVRYE